MTVDLHQRLRALVKARFLDSSDPPKWNKAKLAARLGRANQGYINQWLDYEDQDPSLNDLPVIAEFLGKSPPELVEILVRQSQGVASPDTADDLESRSNRHTGEREHGAEARLLAENRELRLQLAEHVEAIRTATDGIARLAGVVDSHGRVPKAGAGKSKRG